MYHHVNPAGNTVNVTPERFEAQMAHLKEQGFRSLDTKQLLEIVDRNEEIPPKSIMITFDDGWLDNWFYAYPVLKKYALKAVLFVVTSWIGNGPIRKEPHPLPEHRDCMNSIRKGEYRDVVLNWNELKEMESTGVFDIQSHTHSHIRWDKLYRNPSGLKETLKADLLTSKEFLRKELGKDSQALCWPWGVNNPHYKEAAIEAGFRLLFTTKKGCNTRSDISALKRIVIGNIGMFDFKKKLFIHSRQWLSSLYLKLFS